MKTQHLEIHSLVEDMGILPFCPRLQGKLDDLPSNQSAVIPQDAAFRCKGKQPPHLQAPQQPPHLAHLSWPNICSAHAAGRWKQGFLLEKNSQTVARHGIIFLSQFWDIIYMICSFFLILHCAFWYVIRLGLGGSEGSRTLEAVVKCWLKIHHLVRRFSHDVWGIFQQLAVFDNARGYQKVISTASYSAGNCPLTFFAGA